MPSVAIAPKWGDSAFELFSLHLETHFEDIQEKTTHVNPSTPCYCVQNILYKHAVSGFVVSRMETKLEHGCLDIVTYLPFLKRDGLNSPANLGLVLLTWGQKHLGDRHDYPLALLYKAAEKCPCLSWRLFPSRTLCQAELSSQIRLSRSHISPEGEQNKLNCFVFGLFLNIFLYCCF